MKRPNKKAEYPSNDRHSAKTEFNLSRTLGATRHTNYFLRLLLINLTNNAKNLT